MSGIAHSTAPDSTFSTSGATAWSADHIINGPILATDGAVGAPAYSFASDTDTGFYFATAGGNSIFVSIDGTARIRLGPTAAGMALSSSGSYGFTSGAATAAVDLSLFRDAANTLAQRNSTNAQTFRIYNTFTDASNFERGRLEWSSNTFVIGTDGLGTGANRTMQFNVAGSADIQFRLASNTRWTIQGSTGHFLAGTDNTNDIGAAGATRPRNGYFGGTLSFGTHSALAAETVSGYITITDSGGTTRKLAVVS